jgi:hypothetical protein
MTRARWAALFVALLGIGVAGLWVSGAARQPPAQRPALLLLTSLPLVFGEDFSLNGGSPVLKSLQANYHVLPISVASRDELAKGRLLLMAQPPAQTAENLIALDEWVRRGGCLILFADPLLEWPSKRPLGDVLRPPPMFADTGLLAHWGLRLDSPDERGRATRSLAGHKIETVSPGVLYGGCEISADRLVADCRIGKGRAVIVADADLLSAELLGSAAPTNLAAVTQELALLANQ